MKIRARFTSTSGPFRTISEAEFATTTEVLAVVTGIYGSMGYSNFKLIDDGDCDGARITARTPAGREGRNVAFLDYGYEGDDQ